MSESKRLLILVLSHFLFILYHFCWLSDKIQSKHNMNFVKGSSSGMPRPCYNEKPRPAFRLADCVCGCWSTHNERLYQLTTSVKVGLVYFVSRIHSIDFSLNNGIRKRILSFLWFRKNEKRCWTLYQKRWTTPKRRYRK